MVLMNYDTCMSSTVDIGKVWWSSEFLCMNKRQNIYQWGPTYCCTTLCVLPPLHPPLFPVTHTRQMVRKGLLLHKSRGLVAMWIWWWILNIKTVIVKYLVILQEYVSTATMTNIVAGKYEVVIAHPEALLCTEEGRRLLNNPVFCNRVVALVIDECHTVDLW